MYLIWKMTIVQMFDVLAGSILFSLRFKPRKYFHLRLLAGAAISFTVAYFLTKPCSGNGWLNFLYFIIQFLLASATIYVSFETSVIESLLSGACGYVCQHFASNLSGLINGYIDWSPVRNIWGGWLNTLLQQLMYYVPVYSGAYFLVARNMKKTKLLTKYNILVMTFSIISILVCIGITRFTRSTTIKNAKSIAINLYAMTCCIFILIIQFNHHKINESEKNEEVLRYMLEEERKQYEIKKEDIELINIKCHDMRKKIRSFNDRFTQEEITTLNNAITIYDRMIKTGNKTLDVILSEKNLSCTKKNIAITSFGDASALDCLAEHEIYSLLGNALDNAIEAVENLEEEKRHITITMNSIGDLVTIDITNYFDGNIKINNGLPETTKKEEPGYHGFGILSMKKIVEAHKGGIKVSANENLFTVSLYFFK